MEPPSVISTTAPAAVGLRSLPRKQVMLTFGGALLGLFLSSLDQTVVGTAMPRIIADLGGFAQYTWLATVYMVTSTVVLPITGKLTDMYGRKPFYLGGLGIFMVSSALCGLSQTMTQLIILRAIQGIGAGALIAMAFTVVADLFPPAERGKYQGFMSVVFGLSSIIGPTLGGYITDTLSWHWVFWVNIPLGIVAILLFAFFFPNFRPDRRKHSVDYLGMVTLIVGIVPMLLAMSWGGVDYAWNSPQVVGAFTIAAIGIGLFFWIERRAEEPIVPLHIFKNPIVSLAAAVTFLSGTGMFGNIIFIPLYFQGVLGLSATSAGNFLTPMMLGVVTGGAVSGQLLSRTGGHYRLQGMIGLGVMAVGTFLLSRMDLETSYATAIVNIVLTGFGLGVTLPIYVIAIQNAVSYEVLGAATSMVAFLRSIGGVVGLSVFGSIMTNRFASEFLARIPAAVKSVVPPNLLESVTHNAQVLVSPDAQAQLKAMFDQLGPQGLALYEQILRLLRESLNSALSQVFLIGLAVTATAFVINLFLREIPLRKQHVSADGAKGPPDKPPAPPGEHMS